MKLTPDLIASIESYLQHEPGDEGWFREIQLVERFGLPDDRFLRADGSMPGPLSRCTIFSGKGVKHLSRAKPEEIRKCRHRIIKAHASAAHRLQWLDEGIARILDGNIEKITGQGVMPS